MTTECVSWCLRQYLCIYHRVRVRVGLCWFCKYSGTYLLDAMYRFVRIGNWWTLFAAPVCNVHVNVEQQSLQYAAKRRLQRLQLLAGRLMVLSTTKTSDGFVVCDIVFVLTLIEPALGDGMFILVCANRHAIDRSCSWIRLMKLQQPHITRVRDTDEERCTWGLYLKSQTPGITSDPIQSWSGCLCLCEIKVLIRSINVLLLARARLCFGATCQRVGVCLFQTNATMCARRILIALAKWLLNSECRWWVDVEWFSITCNTEHRFRNNFSVIEYWVVVWQKPI